MGKSARRRLIAVLVGILLALLLGEALLAWLDPLGFVYFRDQAYLAAQMIPDPRGYNFRPGTYPLSFALHHPAGRHARRPRYEPARRRRWCSSATA